MKKKLLLFLFLCAGYNIRAQSLSGSVVSTSGAFYANGSGMLSVTIGEMTMVNTFSGGTSILTQGFQQPWDFGVGISELHQTGSFVVYPNPTSGSLNVLMNDVTAAPAWISVYDGTGRLVLKRSFHPGAFLAPVELSLVPFDNGIYLLEISSPNANYQSKINLVK